MAAAQRKKKVSAVSPFSMLGAIFLLGVLFLVGRHFTHEEQPQTEKEPATIHESFRGVVKDRRTGNPLNNVIIRWKGLKNIYASATSNALGEFYIGAQIPSAGAGEIQAVFVKSGYQETKTNRSKTPVYMLKEGDKID